MRGALRWAARLLFDGRTAAIGLEAAAATALARAAVGLDDHVTDVAGVAEAVRKLVYVGGGSYLILAVATAFVFLKG